MPLLFTLLLGILDYWLWFNDSLSVRQGVRESARGAVVQKPTPGCTGTGMAAVACGTRSRILPAGGVAYAKVVAPNGWVRGEIVVICGMVKATGLTGFVPLPADGLIKSKTTMLIENVTSVTTDTSHTDTPPAAGNWDWCTT